MKASELIEKLQELINQHGDLTILIRDHDSDGCWDPSEAENVTFEKKCSWPIMQDSFLIDT